MTSKRVTKEFDLVSRLLSSLNLDVNTIFQAITDISPLAIIITDLQGKILYISRAALKHQGYDKPEEIIGKSAFIFIDPKDHERARYNLGKTLQNGFITDVDYNLVKKDGSHYAGELMASTLRDVQGKTVAFLGVIHDKTDVQETKEQFKFLFENVPVGVGISDKEGRILVANQTMHEIFEYPPKLLINENVKDHYADKNVRADFLTRMLEKGEVANYETQFRKKDGSKFWGNLSSKRLEFSGKTTFITTIADITERKKTESMFREQYQEAIKISDLKSEIITTASHELKTPLIPILGWSDFILNAKINGQDLNEIIKRDELESILRNAIRLQRIVDDFLDVGRIQSHKLTLDYEWVSLQELTRAALRPITQLAQSRQIILHNDVEDLQLFVDGFRIEQVLINLASNAFRYSPEKTNVWIRSHTERGEVEITVEDEGFGFTPNELKEALQPFSSSFLRRKSTQMFAGTGVGLYICKGIIEQHGGTIRISSPGNNRGTKVTITLPLKRASIIQGS